MTIGLAITGHLARVTIDRPEAMNALDEAATEALEQIWRRIELDRAVRVVVLTGGGEHAFCAGADMRADASRTGIDHWAATHPAGFGALSLRTTLDVPIIARVNGHALGGGLEMMLGCDIAIAADHARFGLPAARMGRLPLDGGMVLLPRLIGHRAAMGLLLTGRLIGAAEALGCGLVNAIVPRAGLDAAVDAWVADILACAPLSLRAIKQSARRAAQLGAREAQAMRLPAVVECLQSRDSEEGMRAFRENRPPVWTGR